MKFIEDIKNLTLGEAIDMYDKGMCCVCSKGKLKYFKREVLN